MKKQKFPTSNKQGFTLIEILLVIAIIAILASAILVGISGQRERARTSKVLMELSATLQPMMMCWSDSNSVDTTPNNNENICNGIPSYGTWPNLSSSGWSYNSQNINNITHIFTFTATNGSDSIRCSSTTDSCEEY